MRQIVYYVAASLDGFISGPDGDISGFVEGGDGVRKYINDLASFDTVIMGRNTYEFGYRFGLKPGQPPYPHMSHFVFSNTLKFDSADAKVQIRRVDLQEIMKIREQPGTDIYLCGGGEFAGWLLDNRQIDVLKIKLNPLVLNQGIKLFGNSKGKFATELLDHGIYDHGLQIISYKMKYQE